MFSTMIYHFTVVTIHCVCQKIRWMFRVLEIYNFGTLIFPVSIVYHRVEWNFFQTVQEEKGKFPFLISHSIAIISGIYFLPKSCDNKEFLTCGYYNQIPLLILCNLIISPPIPPPSPHCVFKWILWGHFKPPPSGTIKIMFEVISMRFW